jgi:protein gp37
LEVNEGGYSKINWVIVGGESGPGARPVHPDWVRSIRDQCVAAGVPFFFKQWGEWSPDIEEFDTGNCVFLHVDGTKWDTAIQLPSKVDHSRTVRMERGASWMK